MNKLKSLKKLSLKKIKRFSRRNKKPIHNKNFINSDINQHISQFLDLNSLIAFSKTNKDLNKDLSKTVKIRKHKEHLIKPKLIFIKERQKYNIKNFKEGDIIEFENPNGFNFIYQIYNSQFFQLIPPNLLLPLNYDINYFIKNYFKFNLPVPIPINLIMKNLQSIIINNDLSLNMLSGKFIIRTNSFNSFREINDYVYSLLNLNKDFFVYVERNINEIRIINDNIYKIHENNLIIKNLNEEKSYPIESSEFV